MARVCIENDAEVPSVTVAMENAFLTRELNTKEGRLESVYFRMLSLTARMTDLSPERTSLISA